ncbi:MAG: TolB family protein [Longimicrobiales bacterium]
MFLVTDADADTSSRNAKPIVIDRYRFKSDNGGYLDRKRSHIHVFDIAAKKTDTLTAGDFDDGEPAWSPDGSQIAFSSKREGADPDRFNNSDI